MTLEEIIKSHIAIAGPMRLSDYMALALGHPEFGYYMTRDPLGARGDFITAPEVSQMFGEMLAAWVIDVWQKSGAPQEFILMELGPGRGTLMRDMLRIAEMVPDFIKGAHVHLVETSPTLRSVQEETLKGYAVQWHDRLETVPQDKPIYCVANEFFDALPVQQFVFSDGQWWEHGVAESGTGLQLVRVLATTDLEGVLPHKEPKEGDIFEYARASVVVMGELAARIKAHGGAALVIDYGHAQSDFGDTVQAVRGHTYTGILDHVGESDITAHVDFEKLADAAKGQGMHIFGPVPQGRFLKNLGIVQRAQKLSEAASEAQKSEVDTALIRLTDVDHMGQLFKVMGVIPQDIGAEGFA